MRRIYFLFFLIFLSGSVFSKHSIYRDSLKKKMDLSPVIKGLPDAIISKMGNDLGDTSRESNLNYILDTTMVVSKDFPMPINENSYFDNEIYKARLDSLQKQIPLTYNQYVQSYINLYVYKRRPLIERLLGEGQYYFPIFEKALLEAGLPAELKYLPIIESALNPFAVSRMGATGPWQIMYGTAKDYGLQINSHVDERRDPYRSSQAAARYFKDMFQRYGDWLLVIASYNCGKGNVDKAIRKSNGARDFWSIQRFLPKETRTYVPAFIAATYIMSYAWLHGIHVLNPSFSSHPDTLKIDQKVSLSSLANNLCVSNEEIRRLNPQFRKDWVEGNAEAPVNVWVPGGNSERIPMVLGLLKSNPDQFSSLDPHFNQDEPGTSFISRLIHHRVRKGETLLEISDKYSCTVQDIIAWNHLHSKKLFLGEKLKLKEKVPANFAHNSHSRKGSSFYRVKKGDTLESIALRFRLSIHEIKGLNRLHSNLVRSGQNLKLSNRI